MKLSKPQLNALALLVMAGKHGSSAYSLGVSLTTLNALIKRGLTEYQHRSLADAPSRMFFPQKRIHTITELGYKTHKEKMEGKP